MEDGRGQKVTLVVVCLKFVEIGGHGPKEEDPWVNECGTYRYTVSGCVMLRDLPLRVGTLRVNWPCKFQMGCRLILLIS